MYGRRVGSSLLRLHLSTRLPIPSRPFQCSHDAVSRAAIAFPQRAHYATPGRPRKTVGEPSKTVKRAVKRTSKDPNDIATKKVAANKKTAKPGPKPKAKAKAKTKPKAKAKAKPAKRVLTEEQLAAKAAVKAAKSERTKLTELRKVALEPPPKRTFSAYLMFAKERLSGTSGPSAAKTKMKEVAQQYKDLSPANIEHYNHLAHTETENDAAAYKKWVESHTPEQIQEANRARANLRRRISGKPRQRKYPAIADERRVKRPESQYILFSQNRHASGDFKNIALPERSRLIGQEWKALNESEKKKYVDLQKQDLNRYAQEFNTVYGHQPHFLTNGKGATAVAAAA